MTRVLQRGPAPGPPRGPGGLPSHKLVPRPRGGPGGLLLRGATRASATLAARMTAAIATVNTFIMTSPPDVGASYSRDFAPAENGEQMLFRRTHLRRRLRGADADQRVQLV